MYIWSLVCYTVLYIKYNTRLLQVSWVYYFFLIGGNNRDWFNECVALCMENLFICEANLLARDETTI